MVQRGGGGTWDFLDVSEWGRAPVTGTFPVVQRGGGHLGLGSERGRAPGTFPGSWDPLLPS